MKSPWGLDAPEFKKVVFTYSEKDLKEIELMNKYEGQDFSDEEWEQICEREISGKEIKICAPVEKVACIDSVPIRFKRKAPNQKTGFDFLKTLSPEVQHRVMEHIAERLTKEEEYISKHKE